MTSPTTHRDDPRWQAARAEYIADSRPGDTENTDYLRRVGAAYAMYVTEAEHAGQAPKPMHVLLAESAARDAAYRTTLN